MTSPVVLAHRALEEVLHMIPMIYLTISYIMVFFHSTKYEVHLMMKHGAVQNDIDSTDLGHRIVSFSPFICLGQDDL